VADVRIQRGQTGDGIALRERGGQALPDKLHGDGRHDGRDAELAHEQAVDDAADRADQHDQQHGFHDDPADLAVRHAVRHLGCHEPDRQDGGEVAQGDKGHVHVAADEAEHEAEGDDAVLRELHGHAGPVGDLPQRAGFERRKEQEHNGHQDEQHDRVAVAFVEFLQFHSFAHLP